MAPLEHQAVPQTNPSEFYSLDCASNKMRHAAARALSRIVRCTKSPQTGKHCKSPSGKFDHCYMHVTAPVETLEHFAVQQLPIFAASDRLIPTFEAIVAVLYGFKRNLLNRLSLAEQF
ncbi:MAG: hypothetical protein K0U74_10265 [Alphaproteobacteria bacterium]|nr:hypothetical protein [Alphaproteobacteria bacterium]